MPGLSSYSPWEQATDRPTAFRGDKDTISRAENKINRFIFSPEAQCIFCFRESGKLKLVQTERKSKFTCIFPRCRLISVAYIAIPTRFKRSQLLNLNGWFNVSNPMFCHVSNGLFFATSRRSKNYVATQHVFRRDVAKFPSALRGYENWALLQLGCMAVCEKMSIFAPKIESVFKIISSLSERYFRVYLLSQVAANSGLFAKHERVKMPKRASEKPKNRF